MLMKNYMTAVGFISVCNALVSVTESVPR